MIEIQLISYKPLYYNRLWTYLYVGIDLLHFFLEGSELFSVPEGDSVTASRYFLDLLRQRLVVLFLFVKVTLEEYTGTRRSTTKLQKTTT